MIPRFVAAAAVFVLLLGACAAEKPATSAGSSASCDKGSLPLVQEGVLTVATDRPAYPPWFKGSPQHYTGFEGDLASGIAKQLGLPIKWVVEPFNKSYAPGPKDFDFDINQISITPERSRVVDFSDGYFDDNQGVLALEGGPVTQASSLADLKNAQLGTQVGTTSLTFINSKIQPAGDPKVFDQTNDAKTALENKQIDALVTDVVTTVYLRDFEIKGSTVVGQYPTHEPFGMLFEKGSPLVGCVNDALGKLRSDGTLHKLQSKWLKDYLNVPTLKD